MTKRGSFAEFAFERMSLDRIEQVEQVAVGVGKGVSEVHNVLVEREGEAESESAERFLGFFFF